MQSPREIKKLEEAVINRIAAGEVIQRPANALKEMIENSLDAKSTNIQIVVKSGGLKFLQIQDNGCGIRREDFDIVCERFTTSKLRHFDDLQTIATYGFRGEALASISHVAHLSITSKTHDQVCAYRANFVDGKMQGQPLPTAGNVGTIITVEDLFFNMNVRRKALRSPAEEYQKITEVVGKYAIHNSNVAFALRKSSENNDIRTPSDSTTVDNIRIVYGNSIARELFKVELEESDQLKFRLEGFVSNVNYSSKRLTSLIFINHRLVDCNSLKKCVDQVYSTYLPKNCHPFVYLSLELDPSTIDVNVHPTKHEVHFLNEEPIVETICAYLESKLLTCNNSRVYFTQAKLPGAPEASHPIKDKKINPKDMVRTDASEQKIDKFLLGDDNKSLSASFITKVTKVETKLTSVLQLRQQVEDNCHKSLREIFSQHVFVGTIDPQLALLQHSTKLYLCNTRKILRELFYQTVLYNFENLPSINFSTPLPLRDLALQGLELDEVGWSPDDGPKDRLADKVTEILTEKGQMLNVYFSVEISEDGNLCSIPLLVDNYKPHMGGLPVYVVRLATEVDWTDEKGCFEGFARETASFYSKVEERDNWKWTTEHVLYDFVKGFFIPPKRFAENSAVLEIADLPNLYKVFERC